VNIRREHLNTFPNRRIPETLLMFMRLRGGASAEVNAAFVYAPLADFYELPRAARSLSVADYYKAESTPGIAWNSEVNLAAKALKKDGYITVRGRLTKSAWRLTPDGVKRADFWLKRMTEKSAALSSLTVGSDLVGPGAVGELQTVALS
jgi:hypothetical protein